MIPFKKRCIFAPLSGARQLGYGVMVTLQILVLPFLVRARVAQPQGVQMEVVKTEIPDVLIIEPKVFKDGRGYFFESFNAEEFASKTGLEISFVQDNESMSSYGVIRGLHYQKIPYTQSKIVRCVKGEVIDVAVDIRRGSPTYGRHVSVLLSESNHRQLFIPKGFAHGFSVISETAVFQYKCDEFYHPESEAGINPTDPDLGIDWQVSVDMAILSGKDLRHACLKDTSDFSIRDKL